MVWFCLVFRQKTIIYIICHAINQNSQRIDLIVMDTISGLPRSGKRFWKMKNFPGQGKVRELHFQSGKFKKNEKSHGKVREFQNFPKKMLVNAGFWKF